MISKKRVEIRQGPSGLGGQLTVGKGDVVGLELALADGLGLGKQNRRKGFSSGGVRAVVNAGDACAERCKQNRQGSVARSETFKRNPWRVQVRGGLARTDGERGADVHDFHRVHHHRLEVTLRLSGALERRELFLLEDGTERLGRRGPGAALLLEAEII